MARGGGMGQGGLGKGRTLMHLPNLIRLYWRLLRDPRVSWVAKLVLVAGIAYVIMPFDLIPDFIVVPGYLDDVVVFTLASKAFMRLCPPNVVREHVLLIDQGG